MNTFAAASRRLFADKPVARGGLRPPYAFASRNTQELVTMLRRAFIDTTKDGEFFGDPCSFSRKVRDH
jgi:hypothetical protein